MPMRRRYQPGVWKCQTSTNGNLYPGSDIELFADRYSSAAIISVVGHLPSVISTDVLPRFIQRCARSAAAEKILSLTDQLVRSSRR